MRRTPEDAERTRLALLEAALLTFEEKGWRGATFESVAGRAGVTRGALHHHFRSKTALLEAALEWGWGEYRNRLFPAAETPTITSLLIGFVDLLRGDALFRAVAACTVLVAPQALSDVTEKNAALHAWQQQIAALAPASAGLTADQVADLTLTLFQGFTVTAATRPDDLPPPAELNATMTALGRGVLT